jgi:hypothetical protein
VQGEAEEPASGAHKGTSSTLSFFVSGVIRGFYRIYDDRKSRRLIGETAALKG